MLSCNIGNYIIKRLSEGYIIMKVMKLKEKELKNGIKKFFII